MTQKFRRLGTALLDVWQFAAVGLAMVTILAIVVRTSQSLSTVAESRMRADNAIARSIAESHALEYALHVGCSSTRSWGEYRTEVIERDIAGRRVLRILVRTMTETVAQFECDVLGGSLPDSLRRPLTLCGEVPESVSRSLDPRVVRFGAEVRELPTIDVSSLDTNAIHAASSVAFARDDVLALRRLRTGTDRPDFVFTAEPDGVVRPRFGTEGVLVVDGNLWVDRGEDPLTIELEQSGTVIVHGNLYVDRSLVVRGGGDLLVVVRGRSDVAWVESSGHVSFGIPDDPEHTDRRLTFDASLMADADVHLHVSQVAFGGAMAVAGGLCTEVSGAALEPTGRRIPDPRVRQPGVVLRGSPRPGRLVTFTDS